MEAAAKASVELAREMGLTDEEFGKITTLLGREPNFTELGVFSAMWSEHCSYKNSRALFKLFPTKGKQVLVGAGEENCGIIDIGDGFGVAFKIESHNHPSAVEPFEASATGIGGCLRDIFTTGARPVAGLASLRFGNLNSKRVKFLFKEVARGLAHYANITKTNVVGGETYFDESYEGNPLVNAFVVGIVWKKNIVRGAAKGIGNAVYYIGGKTGRDGVGGASFASKEITQESVSAKNAVAIGDAELGKRLREACLELIEKDLIAGMQDMGAAGLTCSSCETASRSGTGIEIDVSLVPQREKNMTSYEILLSESQERMLAILKKGSEKTALGILKKWKINAVKIGKVTDDDMMRVKEKGIVVCEIPANALTKKSPLYRRETKRPSYLNDTQKLDVSSVKVPENLENVLTTLLDSPTIASKECAYKNFTAIDPSEVMVGTGSDACVIRVKGTKKALAISVDCNSRYCYLNPQNGAMMAVAEAARNIVCSGGRPLAITDGLNFGNPMKPENYWQFKSCIEGLAKACSELNTPVISGNVSFYNENPKGAIDPTPIVGMVGLIENSERCVTQNFKNTGDAVALLGRKDADLAGSEYLYLVHKQKKGDPQIDIELEKNLHKATLEAIQSGIINSAHDCSEGGLAVTLAESCMSSGKNVFGAVIELDNLKSENGRLDIALFGESASRIVVSLDKANVKALEKIAKKHGVPCTVLGSLAGDRLTIRHGSKAVIDVPVAKLGSVWREAIPSRLKK